MNTVFELEVSITVEEVVDVINCLKSRKSLGKDCLINKYFKYMWWFKSTLDKFFLKVISDSGIIPPIWCEGVIVPIFKKGDPNETDNYRGITLWVACWKYLQLYLIKGKWNGMKAILF